MSFGESIRTVFGKYAEFSGRASRPEFWWWMLFVALVNSALSLFAVIPLGVESSLGALLTGLWSLAILLPTLAAGVRRLRDTDNGWGHMFWLLIPAAGLIVLAVMWAQPTKAVTAAP